MLSKRNEAIFFAIFFIVIQAIIIFGLLKYQKCKYVGDIASITIAFLVFTFFELKYKLYISTYTRVIIILTTVAHSLFGDYLGLYRSSRYFDKALHFFGTYSFAFFLYSLLNMITKKHIISKPREFIFILCLGMSFRTFFEILEFLIDIILRPNPPSQGSLGQSGLLDTNLDLICDLFGAILAGLHLLLLNFRVGNNSKK